MKLISEVRIKGFRSIRDASLIDLNDFNAFAGLNNSGKSNVLRALNAFFNGMTEPGKQVNLEDDYFRPDLAKKKAKRISVSVKFALPEQFKFRAGLNEVKTFLGGPTFTIGKVWLRGESVPAYYLAERKLEDPNDRLKIDQFLQLINFRYVPNRVLPIDVIRSEHGALRDVLVRRLARRAMGHEASFEAIRQTSENMIHAFVNRFKVACPDVGEVRLATPMSWSDMIFAFGYRIATQGVEIEDAAQGSGIQSLLMLETLYLIDRDYFQKFGWRQAAIWALEEPESSLHSSLEARIASYLRDISSGDSSRLQVLCTTHSDLMVQYSSKTVFVKQGDGKTSFEPVPDKRVVLDRLSRSGISRWAHPLLHFPLDPLILVEGKFDHAFFQEALRLMRPRRNVRIAFLEQLDDGGATGGTELLPYVKANSKAIKSRNVDSPVIVILDWDAAGKKDAFTKPFKPEDPVRVLV